MKFSAFVCRAAFVGIAYLFFGNNLSAASLRVLIVGDTNDRSIGKSVVTDIGNFETFVRDVAESTGLALDLKIIKGNQVKSKIITDAVKNLNAEADDTVIFYYSGHGFRTKQVKTRWPLLYIPDAGDRGVDFQWVIDTLNTKKPRFILAISDSCNSFIDNAAPSVSSGVMQADQDAAWKKLFAEFSGRIYASGSQIGQFSFGQDATGGIFTSRFLRIVRTAVTAENPTWDNVMKLAAKQILVDNPQQKTQDPQYELVKGQQEHTPLADKENAPPPTSGDVSDEDSENAQMCKALGEFQTALVEVQTALPKRFDFRRQKNDLVGYKSFVVTLTQAGGDKQMIAYTRTMLQGLERKNWNRFLTAIDGYIGHVGTLQEQNCAE